MVFRGQPLYTPRLALGNNLGELEVHLQDVTYSMMLYHHTFWLREEIFGVSLKWEYPAG